MTTTVPPRPARDHRLDIIRGWLQVSILWSHVGPTFLGGWLIHGAYGLSDSSELFVFLSGFTLGSLFARRAAKDGWRVATGDMLGRTRRLYLIHLTVFLLFAALVLWGAMALGLPGQVRTLGWGFLADDPLRAVPAALTMLYQPVFMGILPVFVWCMLLLPPFMALVERLGAWALAAPVAVYAGVHAFGWGVPSLGPETGIAFNPLAWQLPFLLGAWLGQRALFHGRALPHIPALVPICAAIVLAGFVLRAGWHGWIPSPWPETMAWVGKEDLALPRLLHALALAGLVAALVPPSAPWMRGRAAAAIATVGAFSLEAFSLGLFVSWGLGHLLAWAQAGVLGDLGAMAAGIAILCAWAALLQRRREARRPAPAGIQRRRPEPV